ncbi:hypothetical protein ACFYVL_43675 [Streptomyces sp. NPDC004111]|uniref:hypothetical protein n=1 Tax=Streptomyces sp. NPDC004111 TaxID=3364690 RepID=UPI00369682AA
MTTAQWLRAAAHRIGRGSGYLCWFISHRTVSTVRQWITDVLRWLGEASGLKWCVRLGGLLLLGLVARKIGGGLLGAIAAHSDRAAWLLWPAAVVWCIAAYRTHDRPRIIRPKAPAEAASTASEAATVDGPTPLMLCEFIDHLRAAIGDSKGAHLTVLAEHLTKATESTWTPADVRRVCGNAGVPVVDGVRMPGRSPSTGVRRDALPDPSPTPSESGVGGVGTAGQESPTGVPTPTGRAYEIQDDPEDPHRHTMHWPSKGVNTP